MPRKKASREGGKMSSVLLEDYEYFQLFDPDLDDTTDDDSDLDDPVVRRLLSGRDGRAGQRGDCLRKCGCVQCAPAEITTLFRRYLFSKLQCLTQLPLCTSKHVGEFFQYRNTPQACHHCRHCHQHLRPHNRPCARSGRLEGCREQLARGQA